MPSDNNPDTAAEQTILAAADGSTSACRAVAWASAEAVLRGCALHIITSMGYPEATIPIQRPPRPIGAGSAMRASRFWPKPPGQHGQLLRDPNQWSRRN